MFAACRVFCLAFLVGCTPDTSSGDQPGSGLIITTSPAPDIDDMQGTWPGARLELIPCEGEDSPQAPLGNVDLMLSDRVELIAGTWCALRLSGDEPMVLEGTATSGATFSLTLQVDDLYLANGDGVSITEEELTIRLGAIPWPSFALLPRGATEGTITPEDAGHDTLVSDLMARTYVYIDQDADGAEDPGDPIAFAGSPEALGLSAFP